MKSKMLITDEALDANVVDAFHAEQVRRSQRAQIVAKWILGHAVYLVLDPHPGRTKGTITLSAGGHHFTDRSDDYPSEKLVAELSLAIYAGGGLSPSAFAIADLDDETVREALVGHVHSAHVSRYRPGNLPFGPVHP